MTKLSRYTNFDDLKSSKNANKPANTDHEISSSELEELFTLLRNNLVAEKTVSTETVVHEK